MQKFAESGVGRAAAGATEAIGNTAAIAGAGAGIEGGIDGLGKVNDFVTDHPIFQSQATKVANATGALDTAAQQGVGALQQMNDTVGDFKNDLGTSFRQGAADLETSNPDLKMTLSPEQLDSLNALKASKSFALPDYLNQSKTPYSPQTPGEVESPGLQLTPTQSQDLITQLNRSTFSDRSSGLQVDQSKVGLTNEIKEQAKAQFGDQWKKVYDQYSQGISAVDKIHDIVNLDKNATATETQAKLDSILKLGKTPQGKIILQNAVNEFKNVSGYDLTDPIQTVHALLDKQIALETAKKGGFFNQNKGYIGRRLVIGGGMSLLGVYAAANAIRKAVTGQ